MTLKRRTPLKARAGLKRGGGIAPISDRRRRRDATYPAARAEVFDRAGGLCEARACGQCTGRAEQIHHVAGRSGPDPHRAENLLAVCAPCHGHIHAHPSESYEAGWMRSRLGGAA